MSGRLNRRDFLKHTALIGTGVWLSNTSNTRGAPSGSAKRLSPHERLNIAGIGVGGRGAHDIAQVGPENIVALCDVDESQAGKTFDEFPKAQRFTDFRVMLEKRKDIDAVIVATPDHMHAPAALMAMRLGKHVYCEKPLAHTVYECRVMAQVAAETKVATQMGNQGHSNSGSRRAVEIIQRGTIGQVREVHAWSDRPIWPQGMVARPEPEPVPRTLDWDLWLGIAPGRPYSPDYLPFKWRGWWDFGCGAMGDMACHITDVAFWALDLRDPVHIEAKSSTISAEAAPAWSVITWRFPPRGKLSAVTLTWYDGGRKPPQELFKGERVVANGSLIIGDKGTMYVPHAYGAECKLLPLDRFAENAASRPARVRQDAAHHREWITACKTGSPTGSNFGYAAAMTEMLLLGNLALRTGEPIDWDARKMKVTNVPGANGWLRPTYRQGWTL